MRALSRACLRARRAGFPERPATPRAGSVDSGPGAGHIGAMLALRNITFSIEGKKLFDEASATIPAGHKVGFVGRNGSGKTTLFRLIRGELALDGGEIEVPKRARIGGVAQEAPASRDSLVDTVLAADTERAALIAEAEEATDAHRIAEIHARLADIDAHSAEARAAAILNGLGFDAAAQGRACAEFSGGWRMRVALAAVLFARPDVLLLDEPTNYLDLEGAIWLETFLARYPHTVLVISHDRDLLNRSVGAILHLDRQKLTLYQGPYDTFEDTRRARLEQLVAEKKKQDAARAHMQRFVDRFRAKASKARQAQSRIKALERMKPIAAIVEDSVTGFNFPDPRGAVAADRPARGRQRRLRRPPGAPPPRPPDRPGRPDRAPRPERRGQVDAGQAPLRPPRADHRAKDRLLEAPRRLLRPAPGRRARARRDAAPAPRPAPPRRGPGQAPGAARRRRHRRRHRDDRGRPALGRAEVAAGAAARHPRRAAPDHPRRADQPPRHREPRRAGRGADRVRRRGDPRQPRPAPGRARRRAAVAGPRRPGEALRRRHGRLPPDAARRAQRRARRAPATTSRSRAPRPAPRWRRSGPRSRGARRGSRSSRRCGRRSTAGSPTRCSTPAATPRRSRSCRRSAPRSRTGSQRAEALWLAALERLEAAGAG